MCSLITKGTTPLDKSSVGTINFVKIESIDEASGEIKITQKITDEEHNSYLRRSQLKENDILFSIAGTLGRVTSVKLDILPANTNQALAIIRLKSGCLQYIKTYLKGKAVADFIKKNPTIGAQPNLSLEQVGNLEIALPTEKEQALVGAYFESLDNLITLHQSKSFGHILKAIVSCTLSWEQRKVNEIIEDYIEKTTIQNQYTVLTSSQQKGIVYQEEYFSDRQVTTNANIGYYVLPRGYFTYRSRSDTNVFVFNRNDIIDKGIISYYYPVFFNKNSDSNFLLRRLNTGIERQIIMAAEGTGQHVLAHSKFKNMDVFVPYLDEQKRIGKYFESLDHLITLHQLEPFQLIFKAIAYRIIDYAKSKPPRHTKYEIIISFIKYYV